MLRVTGLGIVAESRPVVADVSLQIAGGERVALLGASGSGKSLTARAIVGQPLPGMVTSGAVSMGGKPVLGRPAGRRAPEERVAMVFQDSAVALNPLMPVLRQLVMCLRRGGLGRAAARGGAEQLLAEVGVGPEGLDDRFPGQLSGGQRQRVCVALAVASRASVLVADEPTTALDVVAQAAVLAVLRRAAERDGVGLLFITHDLSAAVGLCERALVLHEGRLVEQGSLPDLLWDARHPYTRTLVAAARAASLPVGTWPANQAAAPRPTA